MGSQEQFSESDERFVRAAQLIANIINGSESGLNHVDTETYRAYLNENPYNGVQHE